MTDKSETGLTEDARTAEMHDAIRRAAAFLRLCRDDESGRGDKAYFGYLDVSIDDDPTGPRARERTRGRLFATALAEVVDKLCAQIPDHGRDVLRAIEERPTSQGPLLYER